MQELAERLKLKEIQYKNLVHTEEECIEWHVLYEIRSSIHGNSI